ncbi:MAG TPA: adenylate/guanylate cyclase domain-containing protein, partial [Candidatus Dormibacteraeota bacterium]|nr:adenylate/guanylate cyclase domain-containing protein [Candidatus Dormibacteraeota bacterium]
MSFDVEVKYAQSGDIHIAYATIGDGPVDMVLVPAGINALNFEAQPLVWGMFAHMASFSRVILYAPRGGGLSDPVPLDALPTMEVRTDDIRAVLDAIGSERAVIIGQGHGGPTSLFFAGTYPDRVASLVLISTYARWQRATDYPVGMPEAATAGFQQLVAGIWGSGGTISGFFPRLAEDPDARRKWAMAERTGASPAQIEGLMAMWTETDVRDILPSIRVPTLVIHRVDDFQFRVGHGRFLAEHITGAKYIEYPGSDHFWVGDDLEELAGEVEEFVTGKRSAVAGDRVLSTVMFTDIVGSTAKASEIGDNAWRELLDRHDEAVRRQIDRYRGSAFKQTGDGVAATFDGPARAITCACGIRDAVRGLGLDVRAGLHTGEIERRGDDVSGVGVHIAARVAALAGPGQVLVSSTVKDLVVGSGIQFEDRGMH